MTSAVNLVIAVLSTRWGHWEEQSRGLLEQNIRTQQLCQYVCSHQAAYRRIFRTISGWFEANSNNYFLWIGLHVFQLQVPANQNYSNLWNCNSFSARYCYTKCGLCHYITCVLMRLAQFIHSVLYCYIREPATYGIRLHLHFTNCDVSTCDLFSFMICPRLNLML